MILQGASAVFLITLGLGQLGAIWWGLRGASLTGPYRRLGYGVGMGLLLGGITLLPATPYVLLWVPVAALLSLLVLLLGGAYIAPPPHPDTLFTAKHPLHGGCRAVNIPDGDDFMPAYLLTPSDKDLSEKGNAVCIVPGAGDNKTFFKWRLVETLLRAGLTVLSIDPHGHGDYRHRPLVYPACLSIVPSAVQFLRSQPGVDRVALIGVSLGGAMVLKALAEQSKSRPPFVEALVVVATPLQINYTTTLFYREAWYTLFRSPSLSLLKDATLKQIWQSWSTGGHQSRHTLFELFTLLRPSESIKQLNGIPILLVYSQADAVAPLSHAQSMLQVAPHASLVKSKKASHVMLTLMPQVNMQLTAWLKTQFTISD